MIVSLWFGLFFLSLFVIGSAVGSFLNVVIYRLPRGKNLFWPYSRFGACLKPIRSWDNIPLLSYWLLGGRCRVCGSPFSLRYFTIELNTGLFFALLYYAEVGLNPHQIPSWRGGGLWYLEAGRFPPDSWPYYL